MLSAARREAIERTEIAEATSRANSEAVLAEEKRILAVKRAELLKQGADDSQALAAKAAARIPKAKDHVMEQFELSFDAAAGTNE